MQRKTRIGIIGCGGRLNSVLWKLLDAGRSKVQVVALCDPDPNAVAFTRTTISKFSGDAAAALKVHASYQEMLQRDDLDWVMVGSTNCLHVEHAVAALHAGKHVFCEKPLATSIDDALMLRETVRQTGRMFFFGLNLRYAWMYRTIRGILDEGRLGELLSFDANETLTFNHGGFIHATSWRPSEALSGGHMLEKCCHDLDVLRWLIGSRPATVASFGDKRLFRPENAHLQDEVGPSDEGMPAYQGAFGYPGIKENPFTRNGDIVDRQVAIVRFANGVVGTFHTQCATSLPERRVCLIGTKGTIRADYFAGRVEFAPIGWGRVSEVQDVPANAGSHGGGDSQLVKSLLASMVEDVPPSTTVDLGVESTVFALAIEQARKLSTVVDMEPIWRRVDNVKA